MPDKVKAGMATPDEVLQEIFNHAEQVADSLHIAAGCNGAVITMINQLAADMPSHGEQLAAVATTVDRYLSEAVEDLDSLTRRTIG